LSADAHLDDLQQVQEVYGNNETWYWLNGVYADRRTSTLDSQIAAGVLYAGFFASRPQDEVGLAIGRTQVNSRVADVERLENAVGRDPIGVQGSEYVGELFYKVQATGWLNLRPGIQYIHDPGGVVKNTDDLVVGLRLSVNF
jgi:porin